MDERDDTSSHVLPELPQPSPPPVFLPPPSSLSFLISSPSFLVSSSSCPYLAGISQTKVNVSRPALERYGRSCQYEMTDADSPRCAYVLASLGVGVTCGTTPLITCEEVRRCGKKEWERERRGR